jgi:redox-sensitive bicupin YhaK (pirin superfamily)
MKMSLRKSEERGHANHGWLKSKHSFSFADYYDPKHVHFRGLRVINEDWVAGGQGFGMHPHRDMEIITWVREGMLEHADTMGNRRTIEPGEAQAMSAGTGVFHSEYNPSADEPVHLFQIWIFPEARGIQPGYDQKKFSEAERKNRFQVLASREGEEGSLTIHTDAKFLVADLEGGRQVDYAVAPGRGVYLHLANGAVKVNGQDLSTGDAVMVEEAEKLEVVASEDSHVLLFDLR